MAAVTWEVLQGATTVVMMAGGAGAEVVACVVVAGEWVVEVAGRLAAWVAVLQVVVVVCRGHS